MGNALIAQFVVHLYLPQNSPRPQNQCGTTDLRVHPNGRKTLKNGRRTTFKNSMESS